MSIERREKLRQRKEKMKKMTPELKEKMVMEKELVKGHILSFIVRTAREFALRQTRETIYDTVIFFFFNFFFT